MNEVSRQILEHFQVRKTKKQKQAFAVFLKQHYPGLWMQEGGFAKNCNLILGNPETAELIFGAHYDTQSVMPFPNLIAPKNPLVTVGMVLIFAVLFAVLGVGMSLLGLPAPIRMLVCLAAVYLLCMGGPANRHTANDNTSGVVTLLELYDRLSESQKQRVALVFFDNEELGLLGSGYFRKKLGRAQREKLLVNLDCVSDGDWLLVVSNKRARARWGDALQRAFQSDVAGKTICHEKAEWAMYPSDQMGFYNSVALAAQHRAPLVGYWLGRIHTARDTVFEQDNIRIYADSCARLAGEIVGQ